MGGEKRDGMGNNSGRDARAAVQGTEEFGVSEIFILWELISIRVLNKIILGRMSDFCEAEFGNRYTKKRSC